MNLGLEVKITLRKFFNILKDVTCKTLQMNSERLILKSEIPATTYMLSNIQLCPSDEHVLLMLNNSVCT